MLSHPSAHSFLVTSSIIARILRYALAIGTLSISISALAQDTSQTKQCIQLRANLPDLCIGFNIKEHSQYEKFNIGDQARNYQYQADSGNHLIAYHVNDNKIVELASILSFDPDPDTARTILKGLETEHEGLLDLSENRQLLDEAGDDAPRLITERKGFYFMGSEPDSHPRLLYQWDVPPESLPAETVPSDFKPYSTVMSIMYASTR